LVKTKPTIMATVLIGGGTGLIGTRLSQLLKAKYYKVSHLSRTARPNAEFPAYQWDVEAGTIDEAAVQQADYVINLAGAGIADRPWTKARKKLIISSRVQSAGLLADTFQRLGHFPKAFVSSSAIGYYGDRGNEWMSEETTPGEGFLSESTEAWESAIQGVAATGVRTVGLRIGIVLSTQGGALEKMLIPFRFYTGTYFGNGEQWYSWVHIDDICRMFIHALETPSMEGFYNGVAPNPVTNKRLVTEMKEAMDSPAIIMPAPAFTLRLAMGEMADAVLYSTRALADKIKKTGFTYQYPVIDKALEDLLKA
jgi:uncharacterized protein (TIGR01777 family)